MWHVALVATVVFQAGAVKPVGEPEALAVGKATAYIVSGDGLQLEVQGPTGVLFDIRGEGDKAATATVSILRAGRFLSETKVPLKPAKKGAPEGLILAGKLGLTVPAGTHTLLIKADRRLALVPAIAKKVPKPISAAPEVELKDTAVAAAATPATQPAATEVKAQPAATAAAPAKSQPAAASAPASSSDPADLEAALAQGQQAIANATPDEGGDRGQGRTALRVAVYDFELSGVDPNIGTVVTDSMLAEVRKLQGISAIGMDEIRDMLSHEANKQILGCENNESCLAEIAGALGVDDLVSGKLSKVDDGVVFLVRRIDQRRAKVVGSVNQRLVTESGEEFLAAIGPAVEQLFPDNPLRPGTERGVPKEMALRLNPPPLPTWSFWTVAGASAAAVGAASFFAVLANNEENSFRSTLDNAEPGQVLDGKTLRGYQDRAERNALNANISLAVAGGLAITAGVMALFVDWYGYGDASVAP